MQVGDMNYERAYEAILLIQSQIFLVMVDTCVKYNPY